MAPGIAAAESNHWLLSKPEQFFEFANSKRKDGGQFSSLMLQLFLFHEDKVLLLTQDHPVLPNGEPRAWTAPYMHVHLRDMEHRSTFKLAMAVLSEAISGNAPPLQGLQSIDPVFQKADMAILSKTELHLNLHFSVAELSGLDADDVEWNLRKDLCPKSNMMFKAAQWFDSGSASALKLANLPPPRLTRAFEKLAQVKTMYDSMARDDSDDPRVTKLCWDHLYFAKQIKQIEDGGHEVSWAIILQRQGAPHHGLLIMEIQQMIFDKYQAGEYSRMIRPTGFAKNRVYEVYEMVGAMNYTAFQLNDDLDFTEIIGTEERVKVQFIGYEARKMFFE